MKRSIISFFLYLIFSPLLVITSPFIIIIYLKEYINKRRLEKMTPKERILNIRENSINGVHHSIGNFKQKLKESSLSYSDRKELYDKICSFNIEYKRGRKSSMKHLIQYRR